MENEKQFKIFVVDDDPFSRELYSQQLQNLGYADITVFENGAACLPALTEMPDLIFLDYSMETLNGVEVLRKIKRFNPDINVVFLSGQEDVETAVNSLKYGAFDYIVKGPRDSERIRQVLEKLQAMRAVLPARQRRLRTIFSFI